MVSFGVCFIVLKWYLRTVVKNFHEIGSGFASGVSAAMSIVSTCFCFLGLSVQLILFTFLFI